MLPVSPSVQSPKAFLRANMREVFKRSAGEVAATITEGSLRFGHEVGELERHKENALPATTDMTDAFRAALDSCDEQYPTISINRDNGISETIVFESDHLQGVHIKSNSRVQGILSPLAANISGADGVNALFLNKHNNLHLLVDNVRLHDAAAYTGVFCRCIEGGVTGEQALFSARSRDSWYSFSSNNSGIYRGGFSNFSSRGDTVEGLKAAFLRLEGVGNGDIVIESFTANFGYDAVVLQEDDDNYVAMLRVTGVNAYQWLRGALFDLCKAREVILQNVMLEARSDQVVGSEVCIARLKNTLDGMGSNLVMTTVNSASDGSTGVRGKFGIEFDGTRWKLSDSQFEAETGIRIKATQVDIAGITSANPAVVETDTPHHFTTGQAVTHLDLPDDFAALDEVTFRVTVVDATHYSIDVDASAFDAYTSGGTTQANVELDLTGVDCRSCEYAIVIAGTDPIYGTIHTHRCKFNESQQYGLISLSAAFNGTWISDGDEFLDAGKDGVATGRNIDLEVNGTIIMYRPRIGRTTNDAAADYFVRASGTGSWTMIDPQWIGTAPVGRIDPSSTLTIKQIGVKGEWTPSAGGSATYTAALGTYSLENGVCHFFGDVTIDVIGTGSATTISGLPVTSHATQYGGGHVPFFTGSNTAVVGLGLTVAPGGTSLILRSLTVAAVATANNGILTSGTRLIFYGSYPVA